MLYGCKVQIWCSTMAEGIVSLIILVCAVGGSLLTMAIMTKPKRRRKRLGTEQIFAKYFATTAPQTSTKKPARVADERPKRENDQVRNSALSPLPLAADALVSESECRRLLPPPRCEPKS